MLRRTPFVAQSGAAGSVVSTLLNGVRTSQDLVSAWSSSTTSSTGAEAVEAIAATSLFSSSQIQTVRTAASKDFRNAILSAPASFYVAPTQSVLTGNATEINSAAPFVAYGSVDAPTAVVDGKEKTFTATPTDERNWSLSGVKTILRNSGAGSSGKGSAIIFAEHNKDLVALAVDMPTAQPGGKCSIASNVDFTGAKAVKLDSKPELQGLALADFTLAQARMSHAAAVSGALDTILTDLLIYAATTARNDHTLYKTTSTQGHLAAIAGGKFALDALIELVGSTEAPGAAAADLVKLYSSTVINDTLFHATQIVKYRGSPEMREGIIQERPPLPETLLSEEAKAAGAKLPSMKGIDFATLKQLQLLAPTIHHADCPWDTLKLNALSKFETSGSGSKATAAALGSMLAPMDLSFQKASFGVPAIIEDAAGLSKLLEKSAKKADGTKNGEGEHIVAYSADLTTNLLASIAVMAKATASGLTATHAVAGEHRTLAAVQLELSAFKRKKILADANRKALGSSIAAMMAVSSTKTDGSSTGYFSTHPTELKMK